MQKPEPAAAAADEEEEGEEEGEEEEKGGEKKDEKESNERVTSLGTVISTVRIKGHWITLLPLGIMIRAL